MTLTPLEECVSLSDFLRACRAHFAYALLFSLCSNLLVLAVPLYMLQVFDRVLTSRSHETLWLLTGAALGALLLNTWLDRLRSRLLSLAGQVLEQHVAPRVLVRALSPNDRPTDRPNDGAAAPASLRDVGQLRAAMTGGTLTSLMDAPWVPLYLGIIYWFHFDLGVIATLGALLMLGWAWLNERFTAAPLERARREGQNAAACADTGLREREVVQALGMRSALLRQWAVFNHAAMAASQQAEVRSGVFFALTRFTRLGLQVAMLADGALLVIDQQLSAGVMLTGTLILSRALAPIENAMSSWKTWVDARAAYRRLDAALRAQALAGEGHEARSQGQWGTTSDTLAVDRLVVVHQGTALLKGVSFTLNAGEALGVIGPSGAGKSVLLRTLAGVLPASAGSVRLDGQPVNAPGAPRLGYLPQQARLFPGTVAQNIARLGEMDEAAVVEAARQARAHEMVLRLPRGYETPVGEGGAWLSAGQMQRLALARALYGQPRLVLLDEPDAHMDGESMEQLQLTLRQLRERGASVVVLTHRPTLVAQMDRLLMLRDGQVLHLGSRAEVLARLNAPATALAPLALHSVEQQGRAA